MVNSKYLLQCTGCCTSGEQEGSPQRPRWQLSLAMLSGEVLAFVVTATGSMFPSPFPISMLKPLARRGMSWRHGDRPNPWRTGSHKAAQGWGQGAAVLTSTSCCLEGNFYLFSYCGQLGSAGLKGLVPSVDTVNKWS